MTLFSRSIIDSFNHSFVRSFVRSFVCSSVRPFVRSSVRSFVHSFIRSFVGSFVRSFVHSFIHSVSQSVIPSVIPSCIHSFIATFSPAFPASRRSKFIPHAATPKKPSKKTMKNLKYDVRTIYIYKQERRTRKPEPLAKHKASKLLEKTTKSDIQGTNANKNIAKRGMMTSREKNNKFLKEIPNLA